MPPNAHPTCTATPLVHELNPCVSLSDALQLQPVPLGHSAAQEATTAPPGPAIACPKASWLEAEKLSDTPPHAVGACTCTLPTGAQVQRSSHIRPTSNGCTRPQADVPIKPEAEPAGLRHHQAVLHCRVTRSTLCMLSLLQPTHCANMHRSGLLRATQQSRKLHRNYRWLAHC
jgi:hypothetical protein